MDLLPFRRLEKVSFVWSLVIFLFGVAASPGAEDQRDSMESLPSDVYVVLEGTIGDGLEVRMTLSRLAPSTEDGAHVEGWYTYKSQRKPIDLWGDMAGDRLQLSESPVGDYPDDGDITGTFDGVWDVEPEEGSTRVSYSGSWSSPNGDSKLPFQLEEIYVPGITAADYYRFAVTTERERGLRMMSQRIDLTFPQFRGEGEGIERVNAFLRLAAADPDRMGDLPASSGETVESSKPLKILSAPSLYEVERNLSLPTTAGEVEWFEGFGHWSYSDEFQIIHNDARLVSIRIYHDEYTGGAHPNAWDHHFTFDLESGKLLTLNDILKPGWEEPLRQLVEEQLREDWEIAPDAPLTTGPLFNDDFELNENWYLSSDAIGFSFVPYEISAYVYGFIRIEVPREKLIHLLAEDSLLLRAVNR